MFPCSSQANVLVWPLKSTLIWKWLSIKQWLVASSNCLFWTVSRDHSMVCFCLMHSVVAGHFISQHKPDFNFNFWSINFIVEMSLYHPSSNGLVLQPKWEEPSSVQNKPKVLKDCGSINHLYILGGQSLWLRDGWSVWFAPGKFFDKYRNRIKGLWFLFFYNLLNPIYSSSSTLCTFAVAM